MESQIKMMAASAEALHFLRKNTKVIDEEVLQHISDYITKEHIGDSNTKFAMIAAATETYKIFLKESKLSDKEILRKVMEKIPMILENMEIAN